MNKYVYTRPAGEKHIISIREWNKSFSKRGRWPFIGAEVYVSESDATVQYLVSPIGKATLLALSPLILLAGCVNVGLKETTLTLYGELFQKRTGSFSSDMVYRSHPESWNKLMKLVGKEE